MTLKQWADNGWLKPHKTSRQEIEFAISLEKYVLNWVTAKYLDLLTN